MAEEKQEQETNWRCMKDAAQYLGITRQTLDTLPIPSYRLGHKRLYHTEELDRFVRSNRIAAKAA